MKVVAYSIKAFEKEPLAIANQKKHDITLISNDLSLQTCGYAQGKDAVLVFTSDDVSAGVINKLADLGIRYIATRSPDMQHIDKKTAELRGIKLANVTALSMPVTEHHTALLSIEASRQIAEQTIKNLDCWQAEQI